MSSENLSKNQSDLDKIKLQKRDQKIQKSLKWTEENPEQRRLHFQKYVQNNSAKT